MKFLIINSFRSMVYVAYFAIIGYGIWTGFYNQGQISGTLPFITVDMGIAPALDVLIGLVGGWIIASLICGLIVTLLDIRDDINDRLPDARQDI
ncbi:MAG: hypothetical protein AAF292_05405 [Pseudomonadota bacterium]